MFRYSRVLTWIPAALVIAAPSLACAGDLKISLSPAYTSGDYGSSISTETYEVPLKVSYQEGPYKISIRIPYQAVTGPQTLVPSIGLVGSPSNGSRRGGDVVRVSNSGPGSANSGPGSANSGPGSANSGSGSSSSVTTSTSAASTAVTSTNSRGTVRGLGDLGVAGSARVLGGQKGDRFKLELGGGAKLPTGDRSAGLSTGQVGLSAQATGIIDLTSDLSLEITFGRFFRTDHSSGVVLRDYFYISTSLSYDITSKLTLGVSVDAQTAHVSQGTAILEAGLFVEYEIMRGTRIGANAFKGFTRDSSAFGGGLTISHKFSI